MTDLDAIPPVEIKLLSVEGRFYDMIAPLVHRASWDERANRRHKQLMTDYYDLKMEYMFKLDALIKREEKK